MSKRPPLTDKEGEVRELTAEDFKHFKPASEVLPPEVYANLPKRKRGERGKQKAPTKEVVTLRLDPEVVAYFKSTGRGWQTRINNFLKAAVDTFQ